MRRKKNVLGRGTVLISDENKTCKEVGAILIGLHILNDRLDKKVQDEI